LDGKGYGSGVSLVDSDRCTPRFCWGDTELMCHLVVLNFNLGTFRLLTRLASDIKTHT